MITIGLNGCGRIGKNFIRALYRNEAAREQIRIGAINVGPTDPALLAYSLLYDSVDRTFSLPIIMHGNTLVIDGDQIPIIAEKDPHACAWGDHAVSWVVDVSGKYTHRERAEEHIAAGAHGVIISAPAINDDITIVYGVNHAQFNKAKHRIVSLGSCTTNAAVPPLHALQALGTIQSVALTTTHAYTNSQSLLDSMGHDHDVRRFRSAALNIVPSATGAVSSIARVLPELNNKIIGGAFRVPVANVSIVDIVAIMERSYSVADINKHLAQYAQQPQMGGIVDITELPLVSSDFLGNSHSVIIDAALTATVGQCVKVVGWYDNEVGYSTRMLDFLLMMAKAK